MKFKVVVSVLLVLAFLGGLAVSQTPPPLDGMQVGQPTGFIQPAFLDLLNHNQVSPSHGRVKILAYRNGAYVPTGQVVAVDNPWPGFSFWIQPVTIQQIGGRWTIISTTP